MMPQIEASINPRALDSTAFARRAVPRQCRRRGSARRPLFALFLQRTISDTSARATARDRRSVIIRAASLGGVRRFHTLQAPLEIGRLDGFAECVDELSQLARLG